MGELRSWRKTGAPILDQPRKLVSSAEVRNDRAICENVRRLNSGLRGKKDDEKPLATGPRGSLPLLLGWGETEKERREWSRLSRLPSDRSDSVYARVGQKRETGIFLFPLAPGLGRTCNPNPTVKE
jgi:hypothetical protein